jgi:hypothetical protein
LFGLSLVGWPVDSPVIVKGYGFGLVWNIVIGIVGGLIAGWLLPMIGILNLFCNWCSDPATDCPVVQTLIAGGLHPSSVEGAGCNAARKIRSILRH